MQSPERIARTILKAKRDALKVAQRDMRDNYYGGRLVPPAKQPPRVKQLRTTYRTHRRLAAQALARINALGFELSGNDREQVEIARNRYDASRLATYTTIEQGFARLTELQNRALVDTVGKTPKEAAPILQQLALDIEAVIVPIVPKGR